MPRDIAHVLSERGVSLTPFLQTQSRRVRPFFANGLQHGYTNVEEGAVYVIEHPPFVQLVLLRIGSLSIIGDLHGRLLDDRARVAAE